jgi:deoxyribodipyrimidine photolyase
VPELALAKTNDIHQPSEKLYLKPIINHDDARKKAIEYYKALSDYTAV